MNNIELKTQRQPEQLATLILLLQRARKADTEQEVSFLLVNETALLTPFRQAFYWTGQTGEKGRISAVSNLPVPNPDSPVSLWVDPLCSYLQSQNITTPVPVDKKDIPEHIRKGWQDYLAPHALWLPMKGIGGLLLAADSKWSDAQCRLLAHWVDGAAQRIELLRHNRSRGLVRKLFRQVRRRRVAALLAVLILSLMFLPVRMSVLAPAEVVSEDPVIVRSPISGVIDSVLVLPNETVSQGDNLFHLDNRELLSRLEVAKQGLEMAQSEYRHASQAAITSAEAQVRKAILRSRIEQQRAEYEYVNEQLQRIEVKAERSGIAIFPDASALRGRPVRLGEKVMTIADAQEVMLEAWVPPADSVELKQGAEVNFFLNIRPGDPLPGQLKNIAYQASMSPDGNFGYRAEILLSPDLPPPRIGLRGTAKIYGPSVSLGYLIFRRPMTALRQMVGW